MNCIHCGAEVAEREEICSLCGKMARVPDTEKPATDQNKTPVEPPADKPAESAPAAQSQSHEGAAYCAGCKKFVYLDANGCCDRGHSVSSMSARGEQVPDAVSHPTGGITYGGAIPTNDEYTNNSGRGNMSTLPPELEGVNWGAFLLTWIWGIGNRVWLSFLVFVPGGSYVMPFVLLIKGNEWAWKNRRWQSVQQFQAVQRTWAIAGITITVIAILLLCVFYIFLGSLSTFLQTSPPAGGQIT